MGEPRVSEETRYVVSWGHILDNEHEHEEPLGVFESATRLNAQDTELDKRQNVINALTIAVRITRALSEEKLEETIRIARGE